MRTGWAALITSIVIVSAWGCADGGVITGEVVVAPGYGGQGVFAALWQIPATQSGTGLVPTGDAVFLGYLAVGVAGTGEQSFKYVFHGIPSGLYFVGAFLWNNEGAGPDLQTDVHEIDETDTLTVDPTVPSETTIKHDIYLGLSEPSLGTISGTVNVGPTVGSTPVQVLLFSGNPFTTTPQLLDQQPVQLTGGSGTYELFNTPTTPVFVMAWADTNGNGSIDFGLDQLSFALEDPVSVDPSTLEATGVDLWLDAQSPSLGSIQGTLALSAPLRDCNVSVLAFSSNFDQNRDANVIGVSTVAGANTATIPFELFSLPVGTLYLYALITAPGLVETQVMGQVPYTGASIATPLPVQLSAAQPNLSGLVFPVGVGRVTGSIQLANVPSDVAEGWVTATQPIEGAPYIVEYAQVSFAPAGLDGGSDAGTDRDTTVQYEVFGLLDGTYQMTFIPDIQMTGDLNTDLDGGTVGVEGSPTSVTIVGGGPVTSDFTYSFQQN